MDLLVAGVISLVAMRDLHLLCVWPGLVQDEPPLAIARVLLEDVRRRQRGVASRQEPALDASDDRGEATTEHTERTSSGVTASCVSLKTCAQVCSTACRPRSGGNPSKVRVHDAASGESGHRAVIASKSCERKAE